jgi:hypothetical protein
MLWRWPVRAHRPIVSVVKRTFEAARRSAASEREIQSVGGFDIGQSESFWLDAADEASDFLFDCLSEDESEAPADEPAAAASEDDPDAGSEVDFEDSLDPESESCEALEPPSFDAAFDGPPVDRSLRAQPVPRKWMAGAEMALRITPPHTGQAGPEVWTEWTTSISWPQLVQM